MPPQPTIHQMEVETVGEEGEAPFHVVIKKKNEQDGARKKKSRKMLP